MTRALIVVVALLLALLGWQWGRAERAGRSADSAVAAEQAASSAYRREADARTEETRRIKRLQENQDAEALARQAAERDAAAARVAVDRLRHSARAVAVLSCPASHPGIASDGSPAANGPDLLADVLGSLAERAEQLASQADSARSAGQLCERAYDGLTK